MPGKLLGMSWANLRELILQERKFLDPVAGVQFQQETAFETQQSALLASYLSTKQSVDAAVMAFSETLEWPELSPSERFFLVARLDFAWEVLSILNTARDGELLIVYPSAESCTTAELLQWLLIDVWPYGCSRFLQAQKWAEQSSSLNLRKLDTAFQRQKCVA
jgi:hypothetical protein